MRIGPSWSAILIWSLTSAVPASAQTTVTLQQGVNGYTGTADSWMFGNAPDQNRGTDRALSLRSEPTDSAMVRFNIFAAEGGPVPDGAAISSATLTLYKFAGPDAVIKASRLLKPWNEAQVTWNVAASGMPWTTAGARGAGSDVLASADGQTSIGNATNDGCDTTPSVPEPASCFMNIDVTSGVQAFASGTAQNFGWKLAQVSSSVPGNYKNFVSRNDLPIFPRRVPRLTITYTTGGGGGPGEFPSPLPAVASGSGEARPTFHSMSLYYNPSGFSAANPPPGNRIFVRYRKASEDPDAAGFAWKQAWPLWYDTRNATAGWGTLPHAYRARGSVVYLTPGTAYIFELGAGSSYQTATFTEHLVGSTRSESVPQDPAIVTIPSQSSTYIIPATGGGTATAYKVYDGWNGTSNNVVNRGGANTESDVGVDNSSAIVVKANFVIVRRVKAAGAATVGIYIAPGVTDVVIEDCEVTDWAWRPHTTQPAPSWGQVGRNEAGGVMLGGNNSRIVVQRNRIHDPHLGANPWEFDHPFGPLGVTIYHGGMQNVIRYNEIYSTNPDKKHWLLDAIAGTDNFSDRGAPGSDSDIYHNYVRNVMDDGIEAEGGGLNVRVWGNYIDHCATGVATTTVHFGPTYVFRNVINRLRIFHTVTGSPRIPDNGIAEPDDDFWERLAAFKAYGSAVENGVRWGGGRRYFFHNTVLQQPKNTYNPPQVFGDLGAGGGIVATTFDNQGMRETWSRNNILDVFRPQNDGLGGRAESIALGAGGTATNDFNFDLSSGALPAAEPNGVSGRPTYKSAHGWSAFPRLTSGPNEPPESVFGTGLGIGIGAFQLNASSLGLDAGTPLPNFSYDIDNLPFARKSGVEISGNPDIGAHDSAATQPMVFGLPAGQ